MALTEIKTSGIADDAVTTDKLANAINTERTANTAKPSLANDANNRVVTGDGSGGLNGEANLTFDGNDLTQTITSSGGQTLTSTGNHAIRITANTDRAAENNTLLALRAQWNDTQVAMIDFQAGDDTTNKDNSKIAFYTAPAGTQEQHMLIESNGNVKINDGDLVIGTAGHGIDFSAQTQSSSTTDEELLDHYEKGKWTPVVKKNGVANGTATVIHGRYVRIGKLCWLSMYARWNSGSNSEGTSGNWQIYGLPFTLQDDDPGTCRIYQSAPAGYFMIDGVDYFSNPTRWQVNSSTYVDLYTGVSSADQAWTTGMMAVAFTGCFQIHE